jgi:hypothetical protein
MITSEFIKHREQMVAEMKAADERIDALVSQMKAVTGEARINVMVEVITELVRQNAAMHDRMSQMHQHMLALLEARQ